MNVHSRYLKALSVSFLLAVVQPSWANESVDFYSQKAFEVEISEVQGRAELCKVLSEGGCSLLEKVFSPGLVKRKLDGSDKLLLDEVMNITPDTASEVKHVGGSDIRQRIVRNAAISLGVSISVAYESNRYNQLWEKYSKFLDTIVRFDVLMMDSDVGQIIVPAIISQLDNYSTTIEEGRTFRVAGKVYRIASQPYFDYQPPSWRDYLSLSFDRPKIPAPSVLPKNDEEISIFRTYLVKGFVAGINVVEQRVEVAYEKMIGDFDGMALYHLLLDYEMITPPEVETNYSAVAVNGRGDEMSIDDTIMRIKVHPRLDGNRDRWKAFSALEEFELNVMESNSSAWGER